MVKFDNWTGTGFYLDPNEYEPFESNTRLAGLNLRYNFTDRFYVDGSYITALESKSGYSAPSGPVGTRDGLRTYAAHVRWADPGVAPGLWLEGELAHQTHADFEMDAWAGYGTVGYRPPSAARPLPGRPAIRDEIRREIRREVRRRYIGRVVAGVVLGAIIQVSVSGRPPARPPSAARPLPGRPAVRDEIRREIRKEVRRRYVGRVVDGVVLGAIIQVSVSGRPPTRAPSADLCWVWSDRSRTRGYWYYCDGN